jgi:hypothetical protein
MFAIHHGYQFSFKVFLFLSRVTFDDGFKVKLYHWKSVFFKGVAELMKLGFPCISHIGKTKLFFAILFF